MVDTYAEELFGFAKSKPMVNANTVLITSVFGNCGIQAITRTFKDYRVKELTMGVSPIKYDAKDQTICFIRFGSNKDVNDCIKRFKYIKEDNPKTLTKISKCFKCDDKIFEKRINGFVYFNANLPSPY